MRLAFYGNNFNMGYFFVKAFRKYGIEAHLFNRDYPLKQEHHKWWTDEELRSDWVTQIDHPGEWLWAAPNLSRLKGVRDLYAALEGFDVLMMAEDGPALFSGLSGIKKVFIAFGSDLQVLPFVNRIFLKPRDTFRRTHDELKKGHLRAIPVALMDYVRYPRLQALQRKGLRQCDALFCYGGHLQPLVKELGIDAERVHYLNLPMANWMYLGQDDPELIEQLRQQYAQVELLFLHPTRQFYLRRDSSPYLKDNDKLFHAYARYLTMTKKRVKLLLLEKGVHLEAAKQLVKKLGLEEAVEWLPEMPNKVLRAYYHLEQVVVCDQYSPHLGTGNIFREATYYGKLIITSFNLDWNRMLYGDDLPPHVFPAQTAEEILAAMQEIEQLPPQAWQQRSEAAKAWFKRQLDADRLFPRYLDIINRVAGGS